MIFLHPDHDPNKITCPSCGTLVDKGKDLCCYCAHEIIADPEGSSLTTKNESDNANLSAPPAPSRSLSQPRAPKSQSESSRKMKKEYVTTPGGDSEFEEKRQLEVEEKSQRACFFD